MTITTQQSSRRAVLASFGADAAVVDEILAYDPDGFSGLRLDEEARFPLPDEPFVEAWRGYADAVARGGMDAVRDSLVQLQFPVAEGISQSDEYRAATRCGARTDSTRAALELQRPRDCRVVIHETWAGAIPIIEPGCREDFVSLVRAFTARNEPIPIPDSMGACIVTGYNNWDRFRRLQRRWIAEHPGAPFSIDRIAHLKAGYQDRFLILGDGWYSDVAPGVLGMTDAEWRALSLRIRREHECTHYWTHRVLARMRNSALDEFVADCCAITDACGEFRPAWLLAFFGLEGFPAFRSTGRLTNYRGSPALSDRAFGVMQRLLVAAAANLDAFTRRSASALAGPRGQLHLLLALADSSLEDLAHPEAPSRLDERLATAFQTANRLVRVDADPMTRAMRG